MSAVTWSKFFWADWLSDPNLRRCSYGAKGLWIDMLAIAMQNEPYGYLKHGDETLSVEDIASITGKRAQHTRTLLAELERRQVLSRDAGGCFYSRRLVRDAIAMQRHRTNGEKGGNPNLIKGTTPPSDKPGLNPPDNPEDKPQKPESISQPPKASGPVTGRDRAAPTALPIAALVRVAEVMGTSLDALQKKQAWIVFGDTFAGWLAEGCDAECDVWPTIASRMAKRRNRGVPDSPNYFRDAVREARDERCAGLKAAAAAAPPAAWISPEEWQSRLDVFKTIGAWSYRWGPKPGDPGCLAPDLEAEGDAATETERDAEPATQTATATEEPRATQTATETAT